MIEAHRNAIRSYLMNHLQTQVVEARRHDIRIGYEAGTSGPTRSQSISSLAFEPSTTMLSYSISA